MLACYRFDRYRTPEDPTSREGALEALTVSAGAEIRAKPSRAPRVIAHAVNAARTLQDTPANDMTPSDLAAQRARALAAELTRLTRGGRAARRRSRPAAWARSPRSRRAATQEPALITLRYEGPAARGPLLGFVGKAVTFDSGGISIKPAAAWRR